MQKHFVKFMSAGVFVAEMTTKKISSWDVAKAAQMSKEIVEAYGSRPCGFYFITVKDDKVIKKSGVYYINGTVETLEELKAKNDPNNRILISNMESNGWDKIVTTCNPYKWVRPFTKDDTVIAI